MSEDNRNIETSSSRLRRLLFRLGLRFFIAVAAAGILFSLRGYNRRGGDKEFAESIATQPFDVFYLRSPLTVYLHQAAWHCVFKPLGASPADAIGACSAVAGGMFVLALLAISRHWLFLLFNLCTPLMFVFMGHVEHYAWVTTLLVVYYALVQRHLERGGALWPALAALLLAAAFHMLAVFHFPTFLYLLRERDPETRQWRWRPSRSEGEILLTMIIVWALALSGAQMSLPVSGLDNGIERLVPLTMPPPAEPDAGDGIAVGEPPAPSSAKRYVLFTMFSWAHLKMWLYFHWMASPLGLVLLLVLVWTIRTRFEKFLLVGVGCAFFWTWLWHPDRAERDWDLFANLAVPLNVLVGLLLAQAQQRLTASAKARQSPEVDDA